MNYAYNRPHEHRLPESQRSIAFDHTRVPPTRSDRWQTIVRNQDRELLWGLLVGMCVLVSVLGIITILLGI